MGIGIGLLFFDDNENSTTLGVPYTQMNIRIAESAQKFENLDLYANRTLKNQKGDPWVKQIFVPKRSHIWMGIFENCMHAVIWVRFKTKIYFRSQHKMS